MTITSTVTNAGIAAEKAASMIASMDVASIRTTSIARIARMSAMYADQEREEAMSESKIGPKEAALREMREQKTARSKKPSILEVRSKVAQIKPKKKKAKR